LKKVLVTLENLAYNHRLSVAQQITENVVQWWL